MTKNACRCWCAAALLLVTCALLSGCAGLKDRRALRDTLARDAGWESHQIHTSQFDIAANAPVGRKGDLLVAYLEGDGRAYLSAAMVSTDPTPTDPVALRMALADSRRGPLVYLARPCQYVLPESGGHCSNLYWTSHRYAPAIIDSLGAALDQEKLRAGASRILLIGYSGGGALAALLAQRRSDVAAIVTVAANLDLAYWTARDGLAPLSGSVDPAHEAGKLSKLPQLHLAGGGDHVVGPDVARAFLQRMPAEPATTTRLLVVPRFDHVCCWAAQWPAILRRPEVQDILKADSAISVSAP